MNEQNQEQELIKVLEFAAEEGQRKDGNSASSKKDKLHFFKYRSSWRDNFILRPSPQIDWAYLSPMESKDSALFLARGESHFPSPYHLLEIKILFQNGCV